MIWFKRQTPAIVSLYPFPIFGHPCLPASSKQWVVSAQLFNEAETDRTSMMRTGPPFLKRICPSTTAAWQLPWETGCFAVVFECWWRNAVCTSTKWIVIWPSVTYTCNTCILITSVHTQAHRFIHLISLDNALIALSSWNHRRSKWCCFHLFLPVSCESNFSKSLADPICFSINDLQRNALTLHGMRF